MITQSSQPSTVFDTFLRPGLGMRVVEEISHYDFDYWNGRMLVWEPPENGCIYTIGVDVAQGVGADRSVVCVIRHGDRTRPDMQVAEFASDTHGSVDLAPIINAIGQLYCEDDKTEALVAIEVNTAGGGDVTQHDLRMRYGYGNIYIRKAYDRLTGLFTTKLGWMTTRSNRPKLISRGLHALVNGHLVLRSPWLIDEMSDFDADLFIGRAKSLKGTHEDRVIAMLIAYWAAHDEEWIAGDDVAESRRLLTDAREVAQDKETIPRDWQNTPVSVEAMHASIDDWF